MAFEQYLHRVMSGVERGAAATALRAALGAAEPLYVGLVSLRNRLYDRGLLRVRPLPRPVVSVGNLTAGGTGKTPVVRWLASRLRDEGRRVAILSRGYKATARAGGLGDEQLMLDRLLNGTVSVHKRSIVIRAHPDRAAAAGAALRQCPELDVFLLDDGFQHRRVARDLDVVLINAVQPFGYGHVLPRGVLREPPAGLRRAGAVVLTHATGADEQQRRGIEREVRRHNPAVPIYQAVHRAVAIHAGDASGGELPLEALRDRRAFAFCGIGHPEGFEREVQGLSGSYAGHRRFPDHHRYTDAELLDLGSAARAAGADVLVTTEKDWVKLSALRSAGDEGKEVPVWRLDVAVRFLRDDEEQLLAQVRQTLHRVRPVPPRAARDPTAPD